MIQDERRSIRYPLGMRCTYRLHGVVEMPASGMIRDVARHGCCLETDTALGEPRDVIEIHFGTPDDPRAGMLVGTVVQRKKTALGWTLGVAFDDQSPAVKWQLLDAAYRRWLVSMTSSSDAEPAGGE